MGAQWRTCDECAGAICEGYCKTCGNAGVVAETTPSNVLPFPMEREITPRIPVTLNISEKEFAKAYMSDGCTLASLPSLDDIASIERAACRMLSSLIGPSDLDHHKARLYREQLQLIAFMRSKGILP